MAAKAKELLGVEAELIRASGGKFEVVADGSLIYSKLQTNQLPDEEKLISELKNLC